MLLSFWTRSMKSLRMSCVILYRSGHWELL
jgi:hypothetical protein